MHNLKRKLFPCIYKNDPPPARPVLPPEPTPLPVDVIDERPSDERDLVKDYVRDTINDGDFREPDWTYLADNSKLEIPEKYRSHMEWYLKRYLAVRDQIARGAVVGRAPAWFIIGIMFRESSFSTKGHFANGDEIIGTNRKTYRVPKGLGPAATWEESVRQALDWERSKKPRFNYLVTPEMNLAEGLEAWEMYNGLGYRKREKYSDYVLAFTTYGSKRGRFVRDGVYDAWAEVTRGGALSMVLYLLERGFIKEEELWRI